MATSKAMNGRSFIKYLASISCYMADSTSGSDTPLSAAHQAQLCAWLEGKLADPLKIININTAVKLINVIRSEAGWAERTVNLSGGSGTSALSETTAKAICDLIYGNHMRCLFTKMRYIETSMYGEIAWIYIDTPGRTQSLTGWLRGGGGGGGGAVGADGGGKNGSHSSHSAAGGQGGTTYLYIGGKMKQSSPGGNGGSGLDCNAGANPSIATAGGNGSSGAYAGVDFTVTAGELIYVRAGRGGGGGGAACASINGTGGNIGTATPGGSGDTSAAGGNAVGRNDYSGEDAVFAGGGGGGGSPYPGYLYPPCPESIAPGKGGNSYISGPQSLWGSAYTGETGSYPTSSGTIWLGSGGMGGICTNGPSQKRTATGIGTGGQGGQASITTDEKVFANGGSGGTVGGLSMNTDCGMWEQLVLVRDGFRTMDQHPYYCDAFYYGLTADGFHCKYDWEGAYGR